MKTAEELDALLWGEKQWKAFIYCHDRSEEFIQPLIRRLKERGLYADSWHKADLALFSTDRREAIREAMDIYEFGLPIWHWTDTTPCAGDANHYDGAYRRFLSSMAANRGRILPFENYGPPHVDDLPDTSKPMDSCGPSDTPYTLLMWNLLPWDWEDVPALNGRVLMMHPGNNGNVEKAIEQAKIYGYEPLPRMPRQNMLRYMRWATTVAGNSSALMFEAPIYHPAFRIQQLGKRNWGRKPVYWHGTSPCSTVADLIEREE